MRLGTTVSALAAMLGSCSDPYPLPPTPCDDYCYATQRAGCSEDDPRACVSDCENAGVLRQAPHCEEAWDQRNACYQAAGDSRFSCVEGLSSPAADICSNEGRALIVCLSPLAGLCLEECLRSKRACDGNEGSCDGACLAQGNECPDEAEAFYRCSLATPVDCSDPQQDMRPIEKIPCITEIGEWFGCLDALSDSAP